MSREPYFPPADDDFNPYAAPEADIGPAKPETFVSEEAEDIRRAHIQHEASIRAIGFLFLLGMCVLVIAGIAVIGAGFSGPIEGPEGEELPGAVMIALGVMILAFAGLYAAMGIGLRRLTVWGRWLTVGVLGLAVGLRLLIILNTAVTNPELLAAEIVAAAIGLLIPGYFLYLLLAQKANMIFSPEYRQIRAATPHIKPKSSIIVWIVLAILALFILFAILAAIVSA